MVLWTNLHILQARVGDGVHVRPGGNFVLQPEHAYGPLLLIAGGIGITPLVSMAQHAWELCQGEEAARQYQANEQSDAASFRTVLCDD